MRPSNKRQSIFTQHQRHFPEGSGSNADKDYQAAMPEISMKKKKKGKGYLEDSQVSQFHFDDDNNHTSNNDT